MKLQLQVSTKDNMFNLGEPSIFNLVQKCLPPELRFVYSASISSYYASQIY